MQYDFRAYWERNIQQWGNYYLDISHGHEQLHAPGWATALYRASIGHIERRLMAERYVHTLAFLDANVRPGIVLSDLGCGTGIFTVQALLRGGTVNAVDFAESAIKMTKETVARHVPTGTVRYLVADVVHQPLPRSDVTLAMGIAPYITDLYAFLGNVLGSTNLLCCLYVDPARWENRLRTICPLLNVRRLQFHSRVDVGRIYAKHGWILVERTDFATGYIDVAKVEEPRSP
jgi:SAM-dependent methyltransferase